MVITRAKRPNTGVTQLMYVGDDVQPGSAPLWPFLVAVAVVAYLSDVFRAKR